MLNFWDMHEEYTELVMDYKKINLHNYIQKTVSFGFIATAVLIKPWHALYAYWRRLLVDFEESNPYQFDSRI